MTLALGKHGIIIQFSVEPKCHLQSLRLHLSRSILRHIYSAFPPIHTLNGATMQATRPLRFRAPLSVGLSIMASAMQIMNIIQFSIMLCVRSCLISTEKRCPMNGVGRAASFRLLFISMIRRRITPQAGNPVPTGYADGGRLQRRQNLTAKLIAMVIHFDVCQVCAGYIPVRIIKQSLRRR